jgi:hypothetical protein
MTASSNHNDSCRRLCIVVQTTDNLYSFLAHCQEHKYTTQDVGKMRLGKQGERYLPVIDGAHSAIFKELPQRYSSKWICMYETKHILRDQTHTTI